MACFREPLILPAVAFASGIFAAHYARFDGLELIGGFLLFLLAGIVGRIAVRRCAWLGWIGCMFVAGIAAAQYHRPDTTPAMDAESGEVLLVRGCVVEPLSVQDDRARFKLEIEPGARALVSLRIDPAQPLPDVRYGSVIEFAARVRNPHNYGNPGAFDYIGYLARRNTFWLMSMSRDADIQKIPERCGSTFRADIIKMRESALARVDSLYGSNSEIGGFFRALLLGDDDRLDRNTSDEFRKTGTYHAIVISGLHISLVAGSLLWLMRRAFAPAWLRLLVAGIAAWVYTLIAGGDAPVLRAGVGFTLALIATATHRRARVLNILAAVALVFLACDPNQLFEPSFQLSFAAVAAIGGLVAPILESTTTVLMNAARDLDNMRPRQSMEVRVAVLRVEFRLLAQTLNMFLGIRPGAATGIVTMGARAVALIGEALILSAGVQFALLVPTVMYFHRVPLTSVLANLITVPLLNGAVGIGLLSLLCNSTLLSTAAGALVQTAGWAIGRFAQVEPSWRPPSPMLWIPIAFMACLVVLVMCLRHRRRMAAVPALLCVLLGIWMYVYERPSGSQGWLEVSAIDVGQGDSLLIVFPDGHTMLLDGGGFPVFKGGSPPRMDIGEQVVSPYLWDRGIRHIDVVAMSHAHDDHAQGLGALIRNFHPSEFWTGVTPGHSADLLLSLARSNGTRIVQPRAGYSKRFGGATVSVLAPAVDYVGAATAKNNDSLVFEITYGRRRFVFTGDAERAVESALALNGSLKPTDVLKVGHHGSKSSSIPEFLAAVRPTFAVISVGEGNLYGHPHPDVISRLSEAHVQTFRTDRAGLTQFRTDGNRLEIGTNTLSGGVR